MRVKSLEASYITIACSLGKHDAKLLQVGSFLAEKLAKPLKLVHVVEPWMGNYVGVPVGLIPPMWANHNDVMEAQIESAQQKLQSYIEEFQLGENAISRIHSGDTVKWILAEAQNSAMTLVGSGEFSEGVFRRFTTAFQVLSQSDHPIMVVPDHFAGLSGEQMTLVLADDLEDHSREAASYAFALSQKLGGVNFYHLHVTGLSRESLKSALDLAQASSHSPLTTPSTLDGVFEASMNGICKAMADRATLSQEEFSARHNTYDQRVISGQPMEGMEEIRRELRPQIEVFGKHHAFHKKPFSFGRMPFQSMVSANSLVIVVPS